MGRMPRCSKDGLNRGAWTASEDKMLTDYIAAHGEGKWSNVSKKTGLKRCGKSCRLRWLNYLRPDIKRGNISDDEEELIIRLHKLLGNRWSLIAGRLPGRTDNEIKNYWNSNLSKKTQESQLILPKLEKQQPPAETCPNININNDHGTSDSSDFLLDFNVEELCQILDPEENITKGSTTDDGENWDRDGELVSSDILTLVSFLDSGVDWAAGIV